MGNKSLLDQNQLSVSRNAGDNSWFANENNLLQFYEWNTFFKRNINRYAEMYYGFSLHPYQHLELYEMNENDTTCIVGSRASAKSYIVAIFGCCRASLYPNSKIIIASGTKGQGKLIVTEKIKNELMQDSPNLCREILNIKDNQNDVIVYFRNGSTIKVVPASENARGNRSTCIIYEEFRMIDKFIVESVLSPFQITRTAPYMKKPEYKDDKSLIEESTDIFISSAWFTSHWMGDFVKNSVKELRNDKKVCVIGTDYSISLKHNIKTYNQIYKDYKKFDPITWAIEYENQMISENTNAFFTYKMFTDNQCLRKPFYPRTTFDYLSRKKNPHSIPKQDGEIRILACDMAFAEGKGNDNSIFTCIRLIPESTTYTSQSAEGSIKEIKQGYRRLVCYLEGIQGGDTVKQAIRIKQLYEDFDTDYCVLDTRNGGLLVYDLLAKVMYDEERDKEYSPWKCMNNDDIANRIKSAGAIENVFAINATAKLNSDIAIEFRFALVENKIEFLLNYNTAKEEILSKIPEYTGAVEVDTEIFYERPFIETQELISESVSLTYEKKEQTGLIAISEQGANRKDRYTSCSYGNYFASLLEQDLLSDHSNYEFCTFVN